ncbi:MAG TPA: DUF1634 domain-containing protein [Gemmataceae bacterium]|jgi:hypothetical protein|nr:DUF1634 domain-containing protein [Gemmataceae bacterium]
MSDDSRPPDRLESMLADLLGRGTFLASIVIAIGLAWSSTETLAAGPAPLGVRIVTAGIVLFIALPVLRLVLMLVGFLRQRDYRFVGITATVLLIIALGLALGMWKSTTKG